MTVPFEPIRPLHCAEVTGPEVERLFGQPNIDRWWNRDPPKPRDWEQLRLDGLLKQIPPEDYRPHYDDEEPF